jgi:two-component system cell cycle response regulator DivK
MSERALVLIVEDNPRNLKLARDVLAHAGYEVLEASSAEDGLALVRGERRPDVVLLDIQLPGMDGVQALEELRADPATAGIPVIALTAFAMKTDRERFLAAGFDRYVEKPLDIHTLPWQVAAALEQGTARA